MQTAVGSFPQPVALEDQKPAGGVWGAKVAWGRAQHSEAEPVLEKGQEECKLCFAAGIEVNFQPCNHGACVACVDNLRRTVVLKVRADFHLFEHDLDQDQQHGHTGLPLRRHNLACSARTVVALLKATLLLQGRPAAAAAALLNHLFSS